MSNQIPRLQYLLSEAQCFLSVFAFDVVNTHFIWTRTSYCIVRRVSRDTWVRQRRPCVVSHGRWLLLPTDCPKSFSPSPLCSLLPAMQVMLWQKMTTYVTKLCWTSLFLFENGDFGQLIDLNYTMKNPQARRIRKSSLWANWVIVKCLPRMLSPVSILSAIGKDFVFSKIVWLIFMFMLLRSYLSPFRFNRAVMCLPKNFCWRGENILTVRHFFVCCN